MILVGGMTNLATRVALSSKFPPHNRFREGSNQNERNDHTRNRWRYFEGKSSVHGTFVSHVVFGVRTTGYPHQLLISFLPFEVYARGPFCNFGYRECDERRLPVEKLIWQSVCAAIAIRRRAERQIRDKPVRSHAGNTVNSTAQLRGILSEMRR
jgi:hypothetical protein